VGVQSPETARAVTLGTFSDDIVEGGLLSLPDAVSLLDMYVKIGEMMHALKVNSQEFSVFCTGKVVQSPCCRNSLFPLTLLTNSLLQYIFLT
jgi:hypothetical protein